MTKFCLNLHPFKFQNTDGNMLQVTSRLSLLVAIVVCITIVVLPLFYFPLFLVVYNLGLILAQDLSSLDMVKFQADVK